MDNVAFHKTGDVQNFLIGEGHELVFLPPYSPFLNPIEHTFSTWKAHIRGPVVVPDVPGKN